MIVVGLGLGEFVDLRFRIIVIGIKRWLDELLFDNVHVTSHFASTQLKNYSPVQIPKVI